MKKMIMTLAAPVLAALMSACAFEIQLGGPKPHLRTSVPETIYQSLLGLDASQTVNLARRPDCYTEVGLFRVVGGAHPSEREVAASWALFATTHSIVSGWLSGRADSSDGSGWRWAYRAWQGITLADKVRTVTRNHQNGLKPFGSGADPRCMPATPEDHFAVSGSLHPSP